MPGTDLLEDTGAAVAAAETIGYPVMLKSTAGGGGIGMKVCRDAEALSREFETVVRLSERSFGSGGVFIERFIERGRQVEVQIFQILQESFAGEHGARMTAMDAATQNATEMIASLTLTFNRARQAAMSLSRGRTAGSW